MWKQNEKQRTQQNEEKKSFLSLRKLRKINRNLPRFCKSSRVICPVKFVAGVGGNDRWAGVAPPGYHAHPPDCPLNILNLS